MIELSAEVVVLDESRSTTGLPTKNETVKTT